jgi:hypothetical protein
MFVATANILCGGHLLAVAVSTLIHHPPTLAHRGSPCTASATAGPPVGVHGAVGSPAPASCQHSVTEATNVQYQDKDCFLIWRTYENVCGGPALRPQALAPPSLGSWDGSGAPRGWERGGTGQGRSQGSALRAGKGLRRVESGAPSRAGLSLHHHHTPQWDDGALSGNSGLGLYEGPGLPPAQPSQQPACQGLARSCQGLPGISEPCGPRNPG